MINKDRIVQQFKELVNIDSISLKEREMSNYLAKKIEEMGYQPIFDGAKAKINGNSDNLIFKVDGNKEISPIVLLAHMDTVMPGEKKQAIIEGDYIRSKGDTVLGGDDASGICVILETIRVLKENNIKHGDIYVVFTVAEEIGLLGSKNLDYSRIDAKYGFVLDNGGPIGTVAVIAPSQIILDIDIIGKASHAGIEPEKGISAIEVASHAISNMKLGRIDYGTTANVGVISGGSATNIVCDKVNIKAEARSIDDKKLIEQINHMRECLEVACGKYGAKLKIDQKKEYTAYNITKSVDMLSILEKAANMSDLGLNLEITGGGSDTNILNSKGILACNISVGMDKIHTTSEQIKISDMVDSVKFLVNCIRNVI